MVGRYMTHSKTDNYLSDNQAADQAVDTDRRRLLLGSGLVLGAGMLAGAAWTGRALAADASMVHIVIFDDDGTRVGKRTVPLVQKTPAEWHKKLSSAEFHILREAGTESPFSGDYSKPDRPGFYRCRGCGNALYSAKTQFHSGTGWPSFWQPIAKENVTRHADYKLGARRTEIKCTQCEGHLGHVFHDGPQPTGLRFCMDSLALRFVPTDSA